MSMRLVVVSGVLLLASCNGTGASAPGGSSVPAAVTSSGVSNPTAPVPAPAPSAPAPVASSSGAPAWSPDDPGALLPSGVDVLAIAVDPVTTTNVYAGTRGGVFKRGAMQSGGVWPWEPLPGVTGTNAVSVGALTIGAFDPLRLYAGLTTGGCLETHDGGQTWGGFAPTNLLAMGFINPPTVFRVTTVAFNPNQSVFYMGTQDIVGATVGILRGQITTGDWTWWTQTAFLPSAVPIPAVVVAKGSSPDGTVVAGTLGLGIFRSIDAGKTWTASNSGLGDLDVSVLALDPVSQTTLYAATGAGVFKSVDTGATWTPCGSGLASRKLTALVVDPVTPANVYASSLDAGVWKSRDGGGTWSPATSGLPVLVNTIAIDPKNPEVLYAGTSSGVFKTTTGGN